MAAFAFVALTGSIETSGDAGTLSVAVQSDLQGAVTDTGEIGDDVGLFPDGLPIVSPVLNCVSLIGKQIPASAIGLPSRGAVIAAAAPVPLPGVLGDFCQVTGAIQAESLLDPAILFQVNLPANWNQKALQFGGGGFNGLPPLTMLGISHAPPGMATPISQGYLTFGGDSGHQGQPFDGTFGLNPRALANYAGESVKRTRDVAVAISKLYYGTAPKLTYHIGQSKGGQEALVAAQRYGADYDGIVSIHPASQLPAMAINWQRMFDAAHRPGAYMNSAKQSLLKTSVLNACDALDGLKDNVVANLKGCATAFNVQTLRCPNGADVGDTCLSDLQIDTLNRSATPMQFAYSLANGITSDGGYPVFEGADLGDLFGLEPLGLAAGYSLLSDPIVRFWIQQNPLSSARGFDHTQWRSRVEYMSSIFDITSPNFDVFRKKGGKIIMLQGTTDTLVPHITTTKLVNKIKQRYGGSAKSFLRYYLQPGFGHGGGDYAVRWDSLTALDNWVTKGKAPVAPVGEAGERTMPLCEEPAWPKYIGGDPNVAASFRCTTS